MAYALDLALGLNQAMFKYEQNAMTDHFNARVQQGEFTRFPNNQISYDESELQYKMHSYNIKVTD